MFFQNPRVELRGSAKKMHGESIHSPLSCVEKYALVSHIINCKYNTFLKGESGIKLKTMYATPINIKSNTPKIEFRAKAVPILVT